MKISLSHYFTVYVLVFLAGVLAAWLIVLWSRYRQSTRNRDKIDCRICGKSVPLDGQILHVRCPSCGARIEVTRSLS